MSPILFKTHTVQNGRITHKKKGKKILQSDFFEKYLEKKNRLVRVHLIVVSWYPGYEEVETQGGNGRKWERERESVEKCCFCLQNDLKEP